MNSANAVQPSATNASVILIACSRSPLSSQLNFFLSKSYTVVQAESCAQVAKLASLYFPDLILMSATHKDECDGFQVCERLQRSLFKRRPAAVMLFGPDDDALIDQAFAAGADEYVREPIHWKLLQYRVDFLIAKRKAELELNDFTRRLEQTNRELQEFTYVVSHDLQEPLHLIRAFAERIRKKSFQCLDEQGTLYLQRIEKAAGRMQSLIDGLLKYSRLSTQAKEFESIDLTDLVREVITDLEVRVDRMGATVKIEELGMVEADPIQMRQLFQNLVSNALKYSSGLEPPCIEVYPSCRQESESGSSFVEIVVKDNGIGFDSCFQEQIFGLFQRLHGRDEYNGTGIGLAICKKIVERHGGSIHARSATGKGAEFVVILPAKQRKRKE